MLIRFTADCSGCSSFAEASATRTRLRSFSGADAVTHIREQLTYGYGVTAQ